MSLQPDRALRRLVADLAVLHPDDVSAVLQGLDPRERGTVEALLREYVAHFEQAPAKVSDIRAHYDLSRLSPWLVDRIETADFAVTAQARQALRDVAVRIFPMASVTALPSAQKRPTFLARMSSLARGAS